MTENDYVMRIVKQFADALARLFFGKGGGVSLEKELDEVSTQFTGLSLTTLRALPAGQIINLCSLNGSLDMNRVYAAGMLLYKDAVLSGEESEAFFSRVRKSSYLLTKVAADFGAFLNEEHEAALQHLTEVLDKEADLQR